MQPVKYNIKIDMEDTGAKQTGIRIKQGDSGILFVFSVTYQGQQYFDEENIPKAVILASNGVSYVGDCAMDESGYYIYTFKGTELSCAGKMVMDLKFTLDSGRESTYSIIFECVNDTIGKSVETSSMNIDEALKLRDQLAQEIAQVPDYIGTIEAKTEECIEDINDVAETWKEEFPDEAAITEKLLLMDNMQSKNTTGKSLELSTSEGGIRLNKVVGDTHKSSNLWDEQWEVGGLDTVGNTTVDSTKIRSKNYISVKSNVAYYYVMPKSTGLRFYDENKTFVSTANGTNASVVTPSNAKYVKFFVVDTTTYGNNIAIVKGTSGSYESYGVTNAGSYGLVDLGSLTWSTFTYGANQTFRVEYSNLPSGFKRPSDNDVVANVYCDKYRTVSLRDIYNTSLDKVVGVHNNALGLLVVDSGYSSASDFKTAMSGVMLAYEIADGKTADEYCLVVSEVGKNLFDSKLLTDSASYVTKNLKLKPNTSYTMSTNLTDTTNVRLYFHSESGTTGTKVSKTNPKTITTDTNGNAYVTYSVASGYSFANYTYQIEEGNVATDYVEYADKTVLLPLSKPLFKDCVIDKDKVVRKYDWVDLGSLTWTYDSSEKRFRTSDVTNFKNNQNIICDKYKTDVSPVTGTKIDKTITGYKTLNWILVNDFDYTSASDFKTAMSGQMLVFERETPTTEQSTSSEWYQLESFKDKTYVDTLEGLASLDVDYGTEKGKISARNFAQQNDNSYLIRELFKASDVDMPSTHNDDTVADDTTVQSEPVSSDNEIS